MPGLFILSNNMGFSQSVPAASRSDSDFGHMLTVHMSSISPHDRHCAHPSLQDRGSISLPVLPDHKHSGQVRKSKNSPRRAVVLTLVQLLLIAHIVVWVLSKKFNWFGGQTITPIEPSESMEFTKSGIVNAGLIFFSIALLSTLILGRWFCGWGCHIVLLQDFCGWIMKKCGVRPRPFRSRLLIYVPLILAIYMFIMPAVHRWGLIPLDNKLAAASSLGENHWLVQTIRTASSAIGFPLPYSNIPDWKVTAHLTTPDFWKTFASYGVAIPFLFICGFAVVYFLGAKGFCTYGCPYGGFFAPLDKLAPGRILVTDACEGCGHCTAVCSSNVRVHEEVREYGMVVDPGCMKCLDCVSVCPNEALYFGFAKPAVLKGKAKNEKPTRKFDFTLPEEFAFAGVFLLSFLAVRGPNLAPMLMAVGIAGIVTYLTWKFWRLIRDPSVTLHHFQLKFKGSMRLAGWLYTVVVLLVVALVADVGVVNASLALARKYDQKVSAVLTQEAVFSGDHKPPDPEVLEWANRGLKYYTLGSRVGEGGIAVIGGDQTTTDIRRAWLLAATSDFPASELRIRRAMDREGPVDGVVASFMWVLEAQKRRDVALNFGEGVIRAHVGFSQTLDSFVQLAFQDNQPALAEQLLAFVADREGHTDGSLRQMMLAKYLQDRMVDSLDYAEPVLLKHVEFHNSLELFGRICNDVEMPQRAIDLCNNRLANFPDDLFTMRSLSMRLFNAGRLAEGVEVTRKTIEIDPKNASAYYFLAMALRDLGKMSEALEAITKALELAPESIPINGAMADILDDNGRRVEAERFRKETRRMQLEQQERLQQQHQH